MMTYEEKKKLIRRIVDYLHKYCEDDKLLHIAQVINLPVTRSTQPCEHKEKVKQ